MDDDINEDIVSTQIGTKSWEGNYWDKDVLAREEYAGEHAGEGVQRPLFDVERYESTEGSEDRLLSLKDPKQIMVNQVKDLLYNLVTDRPENVIDYFEEYVRFVTTRDEKLELILNPCAHFFEIEKLLIERGQWIQWLNDTSEEMKGEGGTFIREYIFKHRMDNFHYGGITLTKFELFALDLAMQIINEQYPVEGTKFWGKIFGLHKDYYIIEANVTKNLLQKALDDEKLVKAEEQQEYKTKFPLEEEEEEGEYKQPIKWNKVKKLKDYIKPPIPKSTFQPTKYAPKETLGNGLNRKIYFVSNEPASDYIQLPDVTPIQIVTARQIKVFFTGVLDNAIKSDPPFPGNESNYLRAQIARISSGTQLSPLGLYSFDFGEGVDDEDEDEEDDVTENEYGIVNIKLPKPEYTLNPDYDPIPLQDLVDPSMAYWVHHMPYILPQGRAKWVDPTIDPNKPLEEGEESVNIKKEKPIPEVGPPILTSASDDMSLEMIPPWSTRLALDLAPFHGNAIVRSNLWLGAFSYALFNDVQFDNVYIGWGHKHNAANFTPKPYFIPQDEYPDGPEITEMTDPDPEEEEYDEILYNLALKEERRLAHEAALSSKE